MRKEEQKKLLKKLKEENVKLIYEICDDETATNEYAKAAHLEYFNNCLEDIQNYEK